MVIRGSISALALSLLIGMSSSAFAGWEGDKASGSKGGHHADKGAAWGGAMGGWGMSEGEGFMTSRLRMVWTMNLSQSQKDKIRKIQRKARATHWDLEDKIEMQADKLFEQYNFPKRDAKAIGKIYSVIFDYRRKIIENGIVTGNKVEALLTKKQWKMIKEKKMKKWGGGWDKMDH